MKQPTPWTLKTVRDRCVIDPATDCWEWQQCLNADGHPQANIMGQHWLVRRWVLHCEGRLIPRMPVTSPGCESTCCNPSHLRHETKGTILKRAYADGRRDRHGEAVRKRQALPLGSLTQLGTARLGKRTEGRIAPIRELVPLARLDDLVFGAWDVIPEDAAQVAFVPRGFRETIRGNGTYRIWTRWPRIARRCRRTSPTTA